MQNLLFFQIINFCAEQVDDASVGRSHLACQWHNLENIFCVAVRATSLSELVSRQYADEALPRSVD